MNVANVIAATTSRYTPTACVRIRSGAGAVHHVKYTTFLVAKASAAEPIPKRMITHCTTPLKEADIVLDDLSCSFCVGNAPGKIDITESVIAEACL